jgi:transcriptional regulator with GAF, ATPase, and Fis domain
MTGDESLRSVDATADECRPILETRRYPVVRWTDRVGTSEVAARRRLVLGSSAASDVVVRDPTVSRVHALLDPKGEGLVVRDLDSRNGTLLNGMRIQEATLNASAELQLGRTRLFVDFNSSLVAPAEVWPEEEFHGLVGKSLAMREMFALLARAAATDAPVLIQGETGTGKELVARAIHSASKRRRGPLVVVDCAALPETLLDAELFGHTKGAFTGAVSARVGAIESANGGTVFLDEVGELPIAMQPKLLRVLESRTVRRIGESEHRPVDVRFIFATHRNLLEMVAHGAFREDLYFRMCVIPVIVPSLRERPEDIELLVRHFLGDDTLTPGFIESLKDITWRGNVRELRNYVDRARALGEDAVRRAGTDPRRTMPADLRQRPDTLTPPPRASVVLPSLNEALPGEEETISTGEMRARSESERTISTAEATPLGLMEDLLAQALAKTGVRIEGNFKVYRENWIELGEREYLRRMLERHDRNVATLAKEAQVDRTYIYRLIKKYKL